MSQVSHFRERCRCCLEPIQRNISLPLEGYFEEMYFEITNMKLNPSNMLSTKVCMICNDEMTCLSRKRTILIENQLKLVELLVQATGGVADVADPFIKVEPLEMLTFKEEEVESLVVKEETIDLFTDEIMPDEMEDDELVPSVSEPVQPKLTCDDRITKLVPRKVRQKRTANTSDDFFCHQCRKHFKNYRTFQGHIAAIHEKVKRFRCNDCSYEGYTRMSVLEHQRNVHNAPRTKTFFCETCGVDYKSSSKLNNHRNSKHLNLRNFGCDFCGRFFFEKGTLRQHMKRHMVDREMFKCDFPGCTSELVSDFLRRHHKRLVHENIRAFACHCGKAFKQKNQLKLHQKNFHDKIKDNQCDECLQLFYTAGGLKGHKETMHPKVERLRHPCETCGLTFSTLNILTQHLKIHNDPTFACDHCDKKFYFKNLLLDHQYHHTTLAFPCQHCSRSFRSESNLNNHLKVVHFKEKQTFRCELCSSTFTRRTTCRDHVMRQHKDLRANVRKDLLERISKMLPEEKTKDSE